MDETTIWRFRGEEDQKTIQWTVFPTNMVQAGAVETLFARFVAHLKGAGYLAMGGQIVDASIVAAPRQRMTDEERDVVKGGGIPEDWQARPRKFAQKDRNARWTLKLGARNAGRTGPP